ncbi:MAG TPA: addiction module toxin, HicA family [Firmicutes bacterium]|nr:addiction module toxin, HicA family [Bacillota bacterium]
MRHPRDLDSATLVKRLSRLGYSRVRQRGSHMTLRTDELGGNRIWVPVRSPIAVGTLRNILGQVALHHRLSMEELLKLLDLD